MPKKQLCEWFIQPNNVPTNEAMAARLAELQILEESKLVHLDVLMSQTSVKKIHGVWKVPHFFITEFTHAKNSFRFLDFFIYNRRQGSAYARIWRFDGKKKSAKITKAKKELEALKKKKGLKN